MANPPSRNQKQKQNKTKTKNQKEIMVGCKENYKESYLYTFIYNEYFISNSPTPPPPPPKKKNGEKRKENTRNKASNKQANTIWMHRSF